jgi:hypothetical protein
MDTKSTKRTQIPNHWSEERRDVTILNSGASWTHIS